LSLLRPRGSATYGKATVDGGEVSKATVDEGDVNEDDVNEATVVFFDDSSNNISAHNSVSP
jgi:hypothetical protein